MPTAISALILVLGLGVAQAQQQGSIAISQFCGMVDSDPAATIPDCAAQDALNVESSIHGSSVKKRHGYSLDATLSYSTNTVNGSAYFVDPNGNNVIVTCNGQQCSKSSNGASYVAFLTTATATPSYWSMISAKGTLYGANDKQDFVFLYDGTTLSYSSTIPRVKFIEFAGGRMVGANQLGNPNRVLYSKQGDFTSWTAGTNSYDPFYDDIGANGSQITGLKLWNNDLFIFQENSITSCYLGDQYTTVCSVISSTLGTIDPKSIILGAGGIYFRGSDGAFWQIGQNGLQNISLGIKTLTDTASGGKAQSNTQTSKSDWQLGASMPSGSWDYSTLPGSITNSSWSVVQNSSASYVVDAMVRVSTVGLTSIGPVQPGYQSFYNSDAWNDATTNWAGSWDRYKLTGGSYWRIPASCPASFVFSVLDANGTVINSHIYSLADLSPNQIICADGTMSNSVCYDTLFSSNVVKVKFSVGTSSMTSVPFIRGSSLYVHANCNAGYVFAYVGGNPDINDPSGYAPFYSTGTVVSPIFDTGFSTPTWGPFSVSISSDANSYMTFGARVSSSPNNDLWTQLTPTINEQFSAAQKRYVQFFSTFTLNSSTNTAALISSMGLSASTTGQFVTQCIQVPSGVTSWGAFSCANSLDGNASIVYAATSAVSCNSLPKADGASWVNQTNNATLTISTNIAMALRFTSGLTSGTETAKIDACTVNWNLGTPAPPVWGLYDSGRNAMFWSFAVDQSATNNRVLKYDLYNNGWWPFSMPVSSMLTYNNNLYLGGSTSGSVFKYGNTGLDSDNGSAINGYFKTKDFSGGNPFDDKTFQKVSVISVNEYNGIISSTWTYDGGRSGYYDITNSTNSAQPYIRNNTWVPLASPARFMNLKLGNANSNAPFEILGYKIDFVWNPTGARKQ